MQPEINIGIVGHVDHGKTTLVSRLSGKWTDTHSEEAKKGITIRLGYANATFYKNGDEYTTKKTKTPSRTVSFIDAPGHETLMATMLSGSSIMDAALLLVSATEKCPQPQTREHLMALKIADIKDIIIVQNKIDLVSKEEVLENYKQIKEFVKGTIAENAPIIPISAQHNININHLIKAIEETFKTPKRDLTKNPRMFVARSFDINKPGSNWEDLEGGVLGGALMQGKLKVGDEIEIRPGLQKENRFLPIKAKIKGIRSGDEKIKEATPGGSIALLTQLDPAVVKSDSLAGNEAGLPGKLPETFLSITVKPNLLKRVVGLKETTEVENIKKGETLMLTVNSAVSVGLVNNISKNGIHMNLKLPICAFKEDKITLSRLVGGRWHLIGYGTMS